MQCSGFLACIRRVTWPFNFIYTSLENRKLWLVYKGWPFVVHRRNVHRQNVHLSHWWRLEGNVWVITHLWPWPCTQSSRGSFQREQQIYWQSLFVLINILPNWGLFGIIKQICHGSVSILMECLPSGGWFSLGLCPPPPPLGKPSSLWETFHQDTPTAMAYLYNIHVWLVYLPQVGRWQ